MNLITFWKRVLSHTKTKWNIDDYPIRYRKQEGEPGLYNIGEIKPWIAQIINWWALAGVGDTKEEAYQDLKNNFHNYLKDNKAPRPGTKVPLTFAESTEIDKLEDIAVDFFEKILDFNYYDCFITDGSTLTEFGMYDDETLEKINFTYSINLTELGDGNILRILTLIKDRKEILGKN